MNEIAMAIYSYTIAHQAFLGASIVAIMLFLYYEMTQKKGRKKTAGVNNGVISCSVEANEIDDNKAHVFIFARRKHFDECKDSREVLVYFLTVGNRITNARFLVPLGLCLISCFALALESNRQSQEVKQSYEKARRH